VTADRVTAFRDLHRTGLFVLPCAWDVPSARLLARLPGGAAIGTTSAGIAATHGLPDGERLDRAAMLAAVAAIVAATDLPVSADLEAGHGSTPEEVYRTVRAAIDAGVAGVNLEDARHAPDSAAPLLDAGEAAERVAAARQAGVDAGVPIVVNARTDVWWSAVGDPPEGRFAGGTARLRRYRAAGADCLFAPGYPRAGAGDAAGAIRALLDAVAGAPVNLLAGPALPDLAELRALGVRRVSTGSALARLAWAAAGSAAGALLTTGRQDSLDSAAALPYPALVELMAGAGPDHDRFNDPPSGG
jgi:2-methylisocitrate lyase-like PEP mutase family enzyme